MHAMQTLSKCCHLLNEMRRKLPLLRTYVLAEAKHINLVTPINKVAIFHSRELLANVDGLPAAVVINCRSTSIRRSSVAKLADN